MSDRRDEPTESESSAGRMERARAAIDRSFEELADRVERAAEAGYEAPPSYEAPRVSGAGAPPPEREQTLPGEEAGRPEADFADGMDERVRHLIAARLRNAERRLELQAQALEAALGEEAVQARLAAEELERARGTLRDVIGEAVREAEDRMRDQVSSVQADLGRDVARANCEALEKFREALGEESRLQWDRLERSLIEGLELRLQRDTAARLEASEARVDDRAAAGLAEARQSIEAVARTSAELESTFEERVEAAVDRAVSAKMKSAAADLSSRVRSQVDDAFAEGRAQVTAEIRNEAQSLVRERVQHVSGELDVRAQAAVDRSASIRSAFEEDVSRLRDELEGVRAELSRRSIKRARVGLESAAAEQLAAAVAALEAKRGEISDELRREASDRSARIAAEFDASAGAARREVEQTTAEGKAELEKSVMRRGEEVVADALASRTAALEQRIDAIARRNAETSEYRLETAVAAAEARIAAADRAQEREETVRRRIDEASTAGEARVRAAEKRLADTLFQIGATVPSSPPPGRDAG